MTDIPVNLDDVEAWKPSGVILGKGNHPVKVVAQENIQGDKHPEVKLQLEAIGGDEQGGEIRDWLHITSEALGRLRMVLEAFGFEIPAGQFNVPDLTGAVAKAIVRQKPKKGDANGRKINFVAGYQPLSEAEQAELTVASAFGGSSIADGDPGPEPNIPF